MKKDNMTSIMEELLKNCDDCDNREICEPRQNLKIILDKGKEIDLAIVNFRRKTQIIINIEILILILWVSFILVLTPSIFSVLFLIGVLFLCLLYGTIIRQKYKKDQLIRLKALGDALGIPKERQEELQRYMERRPTVIAEKMMSCKLRKKYGSNYCVKCPDSYKCASST